MRVVALISGGKDSCFNMMECERYGHRIIALANLKPVTTKDEMDSFMYQTVGHEGIEAYAEAMDLPLFRATITGEPLQQSLSYSPSHVNDEVESLFNLLRFVKESLPEVEAVSSGAILSNYQRNRVESVCQRLGLVSLAYLWRRDQSDLLREMIESNVCAILIKVAALGLRKEHLGKSLSELHEALLKMKDRYDLNVCGEGGEYESFTLDCPLFKKRIVIDESKIVMHSNDPISPVAYLKLVRYHLEEKTSSSKTSSPPKIFYLEKERTETPLPSPSTTMETKEDTREVIRGGKFIVATSEGKKTQEGAKLSLAEQIECIFQHTKESLSKDSLTFANIVAAHIYVRRISDFATLNEVYKKYFQVNPPSRATVEVPLISLDTDVAIEFWALRGKKQSMHVQSISRWAAACIGPYSQLTQLDDVLFLSGQIGLEAPTMQLVSPEQQPTKALEHLQSVLCANDSTSALVCSLTCFHTHLAKANELSSLAQRWAQYSPKQNDLLIQHLEVPALPKGAIFESMAIATTNRLLEKAFTDDGSDEAQETDESRERRGRKTLSISVKNLSGKCQLRCLELRIDNVIGVRHFLLEIPLGEELDSTMDIARTLHTEVVKGGNMEPLSLFAIRVYHHLKAFPMKQLDELKRALSSHSVSFVPVTGIRSNADSVATALLVELYYLKQ